MRTRTWVLVALILLGAASGARAQQAVALITNIKGDVQVAVSGPYAPARLLQSLRPGARVRVGSGGQATVSWVHGGVRVYLTAGPPLTVVEGVPRAASNAQVVRPPERTTALLPSGINVDQMGGGRAARRSPMCLYVGRAMPAAGPLEWFAPSLYDHFTVTLKAPDGSLLLDNLAVKGPPLRPARAADGSAGAVYGVPVTAPLTQAGAYQLTVVGLPRAKGPALTVEAFFRVAAPAVVAALAREQRAAEAQYARQPGDLTPVLVVVGLYLEQHMDMQAWRLAQRLDAANPRVRALLSDLESRLPHASL